MVAVYKFYLRIGSATATQQRVRPIWKDDLALEYALESGQWFYRKQLSGNLVFLKEDYDLIMQEAFGTKFFVEIMKSNDGGVTWSRYWLGKFTKTDCTVNVDDRKITVKPTVVDQYTDILDNWEKEYDLIKLTPAMQKILVRKRPCIQIYTDGDDVVSCFMGNVAWEQDVDMPTDVDEEEYLTRHCHFAPLTSYTEIDFYQAPSAERSRLVQPYVGQIYNGVVLTNSTNYYELVYYEQKTRVPDSEDGWYDIENGLKVFKVGDSHIDDNIQWQYSRSVRGGYDDDFEALPDEMLFRVVNYIDTQWILAAHDAGKAVNVEDGTLVESADDSATDYIVAGQRARFTYYFHIGVPFKIAFYDFWGNFLKGYEFSSYMNSLDFPQGTILVRISMKTTDFGNDKYFYVIDDKATLSATKHTTGVWGRILCNVENIGKTVTREIYSNDLTYNRNYRRAVGYGGSNELVSSNRYSVEPTEWGRRDDGYYFLPPDDNHQYVPIGQSKWINTSLWFLVSTYTTSVDIHARDAYTLNDAYPLWSCISVLLNEVAPGVTFAGNTNYSSFLYSGRDDLGARDNALYITPKSNITAGEYQTPAQTAPVTLKLLLDMLKNTYKCHWFIDEQNRLRIEHVEWFRRGGSYDGNMSVGLDLTAMKNLRTGLSWAYGTNEYSYDKQEMPQRYEFGWMDKVTMLFNGNAMEVVSPYVEQGKIEDISVSQITTDVDYMLLNPSAISNDGFVAMTVEEANAINGIQLSASGGETDMVPIAKYVQGKTCVLRLLIGGSGTATIVWYRGSEREESSISFSLPYSLNDSIITVPQGVTAMSFLASDTAYPSVYSLKPQSGNIKQLPMVSQTYNGTSYILQNGYLSFFMLQDPYWRYDMPASSIKINGVLTGIYSIQKNKKQTVNIPVGNDDPNVQQLIKTGIGNGQIQQMSIRLTSRTAKTQLRYDTE